jgi:hypothetical protein
VSAADKTMGTTKSKLSRKDEFKNPKPETIKIQEE